MGAPDRPRLRTIIASAVLKIDLPWNPARHEQRIARAWRKNQTRSVAVINLVTEGSIEHSILHLLGQKQALADGIIDGEGDRGALKMPLGRGAVIERMQAMMEHDTSRASRVMRRNVMTPRQGRSIFVAKSIKRLMRSCRLHWDAGGISFDGRHDEGGAAMED